MVVISFNLHSMRMNYDQNQYITFPYSFPDEGSAFSSNSFPSYEIGKFTMEL